MRFRIDLKIFIFIILYFFTKQIEIYIAIMLFSLLHELGHVICGLLLGMKPIKVEVMPFGFSVSFNVHIQDFDKKVLNANLLEIKKIIVALSGPITNVIIIGLIMLLDNNYIYNNISIYSNLIIALFNILPIYPLDGGRALKGLIHIICGEKRTRIIIEKVNYITMIIITFLGSIGVFYFKNISIFLVIVFLWWLIMCKRDKECLDD